PAGAGVLNPFPLTDAPERSRVAAVTSEGHMLLFPAAELPLLARGKGVRMIGIPAAKTSGERVIAVAVVPEGGSLKIQAGQRHTVLKPRDLEHYHGDRGRRGLKLPQGFRRVDRVELG